MGMPVLFGWMIGLASGAEVPQGTWEAGSQLPAMQAEVRGEVLAATAGLGALRRSAVRWVLVRATAPCVLVRISEAPEGALSITCDGQRTATALHDGTAATFTGLDGRTMSLVHSIDAAGAIVQTFTNKHGTRTNRFVSQPDGGLQVEVTIASPSLGQPIRYTLHYR